jgi:glyoxylase-like metal-dependent hydrolase (beta-lactamase superfamily II)
MKTGKALLAMTAASLSLAASAVAQTMPELPPQPPQLPPPPLTAEPGSEHVIYPIRNGVYMISGPSSNVVVQVGADGILVVDSGSVASAGALLEQIRRISDKPIFYLLNTSGDPDHIGGNLQIANAGEELAGGNERPTAVQGFGSVTTLAHEGVMLRLIEDGVEEGLPTQTYFVEQKDIFFNGEPVSLISAPGHTPGDSLVMFRRSDVIAAGDVYAPNRYPQIDTARGGSIRRYLASLNHLIRLTIPEFNQQGGTFVVPGHGRLSDEGDIGEYRDMVTFIHDRVQALVEQQMTLDQIKAARPTFDYDPLFGEEAGDRFVEQIYISLTQQGAEQ